VKDVLETTGITASAGLGTNMYLAKIAMDIMAKHSDDYIAYLDEKLFKEKLWDHMPLTDFWRIGNGTVRRLAKYGICTMRHIAMADEDLLYRDFGVDAELLIDHAWGRETATIADIKSYVPKSTSISSGQVLPCDYEHEKGKLIVKEMADLMCLELVDRDMATDSITLMLCYTRALNMEPTRGSIKLDTVTSQASVILPEMEKLYDRIKDPRLPIRKVNVSFNNLVDDAYRQYDLFTNPVVLEKEKNLQKAMISIKKKYGKNSVLKGMNLEEGAKTMERNNQIGGHSSGREL
jgi:DNA polymerase V